MQLIRPCISVAVEMKFPVTSPDQSMLGEALGSHQTSDILMNKSSSINYNKPNMNMQRTRVRVFFLDSRECAA